jgi:hypothetical protein
VRLLVHQRWQHADRSGHGRLPDRVPDIGVLIVIWPV